ncbi:hypothetical protein [Cellvibrio sp. NN19]|uniref:hypothetical protein n=1 Tax=Cellvibrio chitinivorans TaxID=3102792 RepID=UPI002B4061C3|nr:hypothetical protein [Cellvibrio sp. NN19]
MFSSSFVSKCGFLGAAVFSLVGCANVECEKSKVATVLPGTPNAMVGFYLDKKGFPQPTAEKVVVAPGQNIVFVGPEEFTIFLKDGRSPLPKNESSISTTTGSLTLHIPKDVFAQEDRDDPSNKDKDEIVYQYGIRANGKETDPQIIIRPR